MTKKLLYNDRWIEDPPPWLEILDPKLRSDERRQKLSQPSSSKLTMTHGPRVR
jgi:hypothetical protein